MNFSIELNWVMLDVLNYMSVIVVIENMHIDILCKWF